MEILMTSIRTQIEAHSRIVAQQTPDGKHAIISIEDLAELVGLAHQAIHPESLPGTFSEDSKRGAERLMAAIWGEGPEEPETEDQPESKKELDQQEGQFRNLAMHYAVQVVTAKIQAAHGLDSEYPDVVGHAESILAFLKA
jgi:hypothetical protein